MLFQLVEADQTLSRYVTEALNLTADPQGLFRATEAWESYRDMRCAAASARSAGRSIQTALHFGCRFMLSQERLEFIWDAYLRNARTDLPDPATFAR
jgi:uncharacterized protein YecT (DUF1311 family)